eukprot:gene8810-18234_t
MLGFIVTLAKPLNFKNQLKAILAMNVVREIVEIVYNTIMLILNSASSPIPREVYFGRFFTNVWFICICMSLSKSRWVLQMTQPTGNYDKPADSLSDNVRSVLFASLSTSQGFFKKWQQFFVTNEGKNAMIIRPSKIEKSMILALFVSNEERTSS